MLDVRSTLSETGRLTRVLVKHPRDAFVDAATIAREWQSLNFTGAPSLAAANDEYEVFLDILRRNGAQVDFLPRDARANLDSIYARDAAIVVPLPPWRGPGDVLHLMSLLSPVDRDLAVVYSPLLPVPFRTTLLDRGIEFVELPAEEFDTMGVNVLALAPRDCVMVAGNPRTRAALEGAGARVTEYIG